VQTGIYPLLRILRTWGVLEVWLMNIKFKACPVNRTDGNEKLWNPSGFAPDSGRKTHFAQNCPDFAPDSGRKSASRRTVRILPPIPDGNPLRTELSGFCPEFRMETHFG